jgi:hypothetical protein
MMIGLKDNCHARTHLCHMVTNQKIKTSLTSLERPELIALLKDLFDHAIGSRAFLSARFLADGVPDAILDKYRRRIVKQFFPKRGEGKLGLRSARRTIRDYRKADIFPVFPVNPLRQYAINGKITAWNSRDLLRS